MSDKLVAYFSCTGVTRAVAEALAEAIGADLREIVPAEPYTDGDLDYTVKSSRSTVEQEDHACRPAMAEPIDFSSYGTIYVGFPIWWYDAPRIVYSFLDSGDLAGKRVAPFATSGGTGMSEIDGYLSKAYPQASWAKGRRFGSADPAAIREWADAVRRRRQQGPYGIRRRGGPSRTDVRHLVVQSSYFY